MRAERIHNSQMVRQQITDICRIFKVKQRSEISTNYYGDKGEGRLNITAKNKLKGIPHLFSV